MCDPLLSLMEWLKSKMSEFLEFEVPDEMANEIISEDDEKRLQNYLKQMLNVKDPKVRQFIVQLLERKRNLYAEPKPLVKDEDDEKVYSVKRNKIKQNNEPGTSKSSQMQSGSANIACGSNTSKSKKNIDFVVLATTEKGAPLLKGRHECTCEAKEHGLINNCLTCGRIVCEQEGSGPCFFCGELVLTPEEQVIFNSGDGRIKSKLYEELVTQEMPPGLQEAIDQRNRLLKYAAENISERQVYDDDGYYNVRPRLSDEDSDVDELQLECTKGIKRVHIDPDPLPSDNSQDSADHPLITLTRSLEPSDVENETVDREYAHDASDNDNSNFESDTIVSCAKPASEDDEPTYWMDGCDDGELLPDMEKEQPDGCDDGVVLPDTESEQPEVAFLKGHEKADVLGSVALKSPERIATLRQQMDACFYRPVSKKTKKRKQKKDSIQYEKFVEPDYSQLNGKSSNNNLDKGFCLSINQPWASFLIEGIKLEEGRSWYTDYRGPLWIASTGFRVSNEQIKKFQNLYRFIKEDVTFPENYPTGSLLGVVELVDCLPQEQYREEHPDGEIEDPFVFMCQNPKAIRHPYPIKGHPKIFQLDEKVLKVAQKILKMDHT